MKKILVYVNSMNNYGGIERVISNLSNELSKYYEITILVKDKPVSAYKMNSLVNIETIDVELKMNMNSRLKRVYQVFFNILKSIKALNCYLKDNKFDYVYTALPTNGLEVYLADKEYRSKIIASEHASYYAYNSIYKKIKKWLYPKLIAISVPTKMDTEIYKKLGYNAFYIPHMNTYSKLHNNQLSSKRIINVGRLTRDKQQSLLLDIWNNVNQKIGNTSWHLQIIGSGEEEDYLKKQIKDKKIKNVELIPHTSQIQDYYTNADLFVFTSKMEGFGMVLLEAMSFGIPCISFDCPSGPRDIIKNNINGYLVECYNTKQFEECIIKYMKMDYCNKRLLSDNAIETIKEWNNDEIIKKWRMLFK